jgi:putative membrane protein
MLSSRVMFNNIKLALKGMLMGIAEVIPGVSGGTIAFITGIYERLIDAIRSVDLQFAGHIGKGRLRTAWGHIDGNFLAVLLIGMAIGVVTGVFGVTHLMDNYPEELWGFFFGLIVASAIYIGRRVQHWSWDKIILLLLGGVFSYGITVLSPAVGSQSLIYVFASGLIAISALILPGISGSFILLLLGMYTVVIPSVKQLLTLQFDALPIVLAFGIGCIIGVMSFSRVLSWLFHNFHNRTLAFLTGVMIGSLNKIWPWRNPEQWLSESGEIIASSEIVEDAKLLVEHNVAPANYTLADPNTLVVVICAIVGFTIVFATDSLLGESSTD